jgi:hypothetical protein
LQTSATSTTAYPWEGVDAGTTPTTADPRNAKATPTPDITFEATPTSGMSAAAAAENVPTSGVDDTEDHSNAKGNEFEMFVDIEPVTTGCCACFRHRRGRYIPTPTEGDDLGQVRTTTGQGLNRSGGVRSGGLAVGLRKPRRPVDGFTADEEVAFLLKCDELERNDD